MYHHKCMISIYRFSVLICILLTNAPYKPVTSTITISRALVWAKEYPYLLRHRGFVFHWAQWYLVWLLWPGPLAVVITGVTLMVSFDWFAYKTRGFD